MVKCTFDYPDHIKQKKVGPSSKINKIPHELNKKGDDSKNTSCIPFNVKNDKMTMCKLEHRKPIQLGCSIFYPPGWNSLSLSWCGVINLCNKKSNSCAFDIDGILKVELP